MRIRRLAGSLAESEFVLSEDAQKAACPLAEKAAGDYFQRLFRSLRTTKLCKISAKTKDFAAQTRCAQTYAAKSLTQIFYRASSLKLLQMPLKTILRCFSCLFLDFEMILSM